VDVRVLAALMAVRAGKSRSAVEAPRLVSVPVRFAGLRFNRASDDSAGQSIADCFEIAHSYPRRRH
jgi:hypothetical protein